MKQCQIEESALYTPGRHTFVTDPLLLSDFSEGWNILANACLHLISSISDLYQVSELASSIYHMYQDCILKYNL